jgi:hypothetical protein
VTLLCNVKTSSHHIYVMKMIYELYFFLYKKTLFKYLIMLLIFCKLKYWKGKFSGSKILVHCFGYLVVEIIMDFIINVIDNIIHQHNINSLDKFIWQRLIHLQLKDLHKISDLRVLTREQM